VSACWRNAAHYDREFASRLTTSTKPDACVQRQPDVLWTPEPLRNVGYWGKTGKHSLVASSRLLNPTAVIAIAANDLDGLNKNSRVRGALLRFSRTK
jgi:hypothetical protein